MARKYFGTDGMRGEANKDLTIDLVTNLGLALGYYLKKNNNKTSLHKKIDPFILSSWETQWRGDL